MAKSGLMMYCFWFASARPLPLHLTLPHFRVFDPPNVLAVVFDANFTSWRRAKKFVTSGARHTIRGFKFEAFVWGLWGWAGWNMRSCSFSWQALFFPVPVTLSFVLFTDLQRFTVTAAPHQYPHVGGLLAASNRLSIGCGNVGTITRSVSFSRLSAMFESVVGVCGGARFSPMFWHVLAMWRSCRHIPTKCKDVHSLLKNAKTTHSKSKWPSPAKSDLAFDYALPMSHFGSFGGGGCFVFLCLWGYFLWQVQYCSAWIWLCFGTFGVNWVTLEHLKVFHDLEIASCGPPGAVGNMFYISMWGYLAPHHVTMSRTCMHKWWKGHPFPRICSNHKGRMTVTRVIWPNVACAKVNLSLTWERSWRSWASWGMHFRPWALMIRDDLRCLVSIDVSQKLSRDGWSTYPLWACQSPTPLQYQ